MSPQNGSTILALTSLSPAPHHADRQRAAVQSWRQAGLEVRSFNHPSEMAALASLYDVELIPVERTTAHLFGRHFVPIKVMLDWAATCGHPVMIVNSDITMQLAPWELQRLRWASAGGLCCFIRYNYDADMQAGVREPFGFDAFLLGGVEAGLFDDSFLCMGQPFWDYWLPQVFAAAGRDLTSVEFPAVFHQAHPRSWSWDGWHRCAIEFDRLTPTLGADRSLEACLAMSGQVRHSIGRACRSLTPRPMPIREWVEGRFHHAGEKTFLEAGAHCGSDTEWLSRIPGVTIHAFEPDPRNEQRPLSNVTLHRAALAEADGRADFILSDRGWGHTWTYSSSLRRPKHHLQRYPVTFGGSIQVETVALDSFARRAGLGVVDFIWADIQGAEGDMVRGGLETLARTRYLYTEYSDEELYEGQVTLRDLLTMLPDFRVIELWPEDVLLENRRFEACP